MKVKKLIEELTKLPQDLDVLLYDPFDEYEYTSCLVIKPVLYSKTAWNPVSFSTTVDKCNGVVLC